MYCAVLCCVAQAQPLLDANKWDELVDPCILVQGGGRQRGGHTVPSSLLILSLCLLVLLCCVAQAQPLLDAEKWDELVDPCILDQRGGVNGVVGHGFKAQVSPTSSLARTAQLAKACISYDPLARPSIEEVAHDLQLIYYGQSCAGS